MPHHAGSKGRASNDAATLQAFVVDIFWAFSSITSGLESIPKHLVLLVNDLEMGRKEFAMPHDINTMTRRKEPIDSEIDVRCHVKLRSCVSRSVPRMKDA